MEGGTGRLGVPGVESSKPKSGLQVELEGKEAWKDEESYHGSLVASMWVAVETRMLGTDQLTIKSSHRTRENER